MADNWKAVGDAITARMGQIGMQQKELAALSNVSPSMIREIQAGKKRRRNPRVLRDISEALGLGPNHLPSLLLNGRPDQQPPEADADEVVGDPSAFLAKLAFVLERRIGHVVDVIYNSDSDVDITVEIRHSPRDDLGQPRPER